MAAMVSTVSVNRVTMMFTRVFVLFVRDYVLIYIPCFIDFGKYICSLYRCMIKYWFMSCVIIKGGIEKYAVYVTCIRAICKDNTFLRRPSNV